MGAANALVAATVPRQQVGFAMGLVQVGMGIGLGLGPVIGGAVADAFGYRAAFYVTSALLGLAGIIVFFGVKETAAPGRSTPGSPPGIFSEWPRLLSTPGVIMVYTLRFINQMGRMLFIPILPMFILILIDSTARVNSFTGLVIGISAAATATFAVFLAAGAIVSDIAGF